MTEKMSLKIRALSDERDLRRKRTNNFHYVNRKLKNKKDKIDFFAKCI